MLRLQVDAPFHRELELLLGALEDRDRLAVVHAHELGVDDALQLGDDALLDALVEEGHVFFSLGQEGLNTYFKSASARSALSFRSANAISGSIIQNSARWRLVLEFSARNVGPKV